MWKGLFEMIRPVDMQLAVPRTQELTQNNAQGRPELQQQQFAQQLNKRVEQENQTVNQTNKSEGQNVDKDGSNGGTGGKNRRKNGEKKDEKAKPKPYERSGLLDIKG